MPDSIVVLGSITAMPVAGVIWQTVHYIKGFERLGYDVYYVEAHGRAPHMLMTSPEDDGTALATALLARVMGRIGLGGSWCYQALHEGETCYGMSREQLSRAYSGAAAIINMHGGTVPRPEHRTGRLVYLETDPVPIQVGVAQGNQEDIDFLAQHDVFFSYGENYRAPDCGVPQSDRFHFIPTRQPVELMYWPYSHVAADVMTTVGNWSQYQDVVVDGETYSWSKRLEFLKFIDLPARVVQPIELSLSQCGPEDSALLLKHGWRVRDALAFSYAPLEYRDYIAASRGEFTVAKDQNVRLRSGWFSDRSAVYLASGRPVVTQDTGFGNVLPTGEGLIAFRTMDEAVEGIERINADYQRHRQAARRVAVEYFSSDVVLGDMLRELDLPVHRRPVAAEA